MEIMHISSESKVNGAYPLNTSTLKFYIENVINMLFVLLL